MSAFSLELMCHAFIGILPSSHRWKTPSGGEQRETRRETKHERAMRASSSGLTAGVCYRKPHVERVTSTRRPLCLAWFEAFLFFLAAACPSTWGMRCLMFTKLLSRETTTTCSSDRVLDCRDRLFSRPNSHSGNAVLLK